MRRVHRQPPGLAVLSSAGFYVLRLFVITTAPAQSVLFSLASAILAGGVFAALLKSFQFNTIRLGVEDHFHKLDRTAFPGR
jgi:hypothetical protein